MTIGSFCIYLCQINIIDKLEGGYFKIKSIKNLLD